MCSLLQQHYGPSGNLLSCDACTSSESIQLGIGKNDVLLQILVLAHGLLKALPQYAIPVWHVFGGALTGRNIFFLYLSMELQCIKTSSNFDITKYPKVFHLDPSQDFQSDFLDSLWIRSSCTFPWF